MIKETINNFKKDLKSDSYTIKKNIPKILANIFVYRSLSKNGEAFY
jgi:hypothetical protein